MTGPAGSASSRLRPADTWPLAIGGVASRPLRALLSALGVAIGIATMVSVLGISSSSRAQLIAEIDALGTNLLTVTPSNSFSGQAGALPVTAPSMIDRIGPVISAAAIADVPANIYRNAHVPAANTEAITVYSADTNLPRAVQAQLADGRFLTQATARYPAVVLGAAAAAALGIDRADGSAQVWLGNHWFTVVGILRPVVLAPELDRAALIGHPIARQLLHGSDAPVQIYVRASPDSMATVQADLPYAADPAAPQDVAVTDPADALIARADATAAFQGLFLALGGIALLVGGIGIANVMVISVLERQAEIGVRRALGARRLHIALQFVAEAVVLAGAGGAVGALTGGFATTMYAASRHWAAVVPWPVLLAAVGLGVVIGGLAGLYPALRAARLAPADALRLR
ncbi:MAG: ABC transporter permease [Actinobacteria bacterium]|nr:ABC transporter permease [Actinomycetota bacterium]